MTITFKHYVARLRSDKVRWTEQNFSFSVFFFFRRNPKDRFIFYSKIVV